MAAADHGSPLAAASCCLFLADPRVGGLRHVVDSVSELLDPSLRPNALSSAVRVRSRRLVERVATRLQHTPSLDRSLRLHRLMRGMDDAIRQGDVEIVRCLYVAEPLALRDECAKMAMESAGTLAVVKWAVTQCCGGHCDGCLNDVEVVAACDDAERLRVFKWLMESGHVTEFPKSWAVTAGADGDLDAVRWIVESGRGASTLSNSVLQTAGEHGHLSIVTYLRACGYEAEDYRAMFDRAVVRDHSRVIEYLQSERLCRPLPDDLLVTRAATQGCVQLLHTIDSVSARDLSELPLMAIAYEKGHLDVMQWLFEEHGARTVNLWVRPAVQTEARRREILQWVHSVGIGLWSPIVVESAARDGYLKLLHWLHTNRLAAWTPAVMDTAASHGHLAVVQWLHETRTEGCTDWAMDQAAAGGHLGVVQWLHEHRSEGCTTAAMDGAAKSGHLDVLIWLHENRSEGCTFAAMDKAGRLDVVQWLFDHGYRSCTRDAMDLAARKGDLPLVAFLHANMPQSVSFTAPFVAASSGHFSIVKWLHERSRGPQDFEPRFVHEAASLNRRHTILKWLRTLQIDRTRHGS